MPGTELSMGERNKNTKQIVPSIKQLITYLERRVNDQLY